jgi:hypothetical protein
MKTQVCDFTICGPLNMWCKEYSPLHQGVICLPLHVVQKQKQKQKQKQFYFRADIRRTVRLSVFSSQDSRHVEHNVFMHTIKQNSVSLGRQIDGLKLLQAECTKNRMVEHERLTSIILQISVCCRGGLRGFRVHNEPKICASGASH